MLLHAFKDDHSMLEAGTYESQLCKSSMHAFIWYMSQLWPYYIQRTWSGFTVEKAGAMHLLRQH